MNIYFFGMLIAMAVFLLIGFYVSKKVRSAEDFYVAGRRAPVLLIAGSVIASYIGTGLFMGEVGEVYDGLFAPILIDAILASTGYIVGSVYFGRYLRRSRTMTIPEYFGKRFCSRRMHILAAVTAVVTMTVYLLSVMQGIGTLMSSVTGLDYNLCMVLAWVVLTAITVLAGSRGVLITDTLMATVFTLALVVGAFAISGRLGGWYPAIRELASRPELSDLLSWSGRLGYLYDSGAENIAWGVVYGVVWMSVLMVAPWQASRYQMAKNESVVVRSGIWAAFGVFWVYILAYIPSILLHLAEPEVNSSSEVMIWAAMHMMPTVLGVVLLVGVLSAGISSATTFLSLIGASVANDVFRAEGKRSIAVGRLAMIGAAAAVLVLAVFNPPSIFWIVYMGSSIIASSWMPVALASVFSKRVTKTGAFCGMLTGFVVCFAMKLYVNLSGVTLPVVFDPSLVGMATNVIAMAIGSALTRVTAGEKQMREALHVLPAEERDPAEAQKTLKTARIGLLLGLFITAALLVVWIVPYYQGLHSIG